MTEPRTIAITGAGGLIGDLLEEHLAGRYDVRPLTRDDADITDLDAIVSAFDGVDTVVHLAATSEVDSPWEAVLDANIIGVYNVYEAARQAGVRRVVFASSNHAVGMYQWDDAYFPEADQPKIVPADAPVRPDSLYGASKVWGEALGRFYVERLEALSVICLRIGWVTEHDEPPTPLHAARKEAQHVRDRGPGMWLSQRDCMTLIEAAIRTDERYAVVFGVSDNDGRWLSLEEGERLLGWRPQDGHRP